jgi:mycothiol synthase
VAALPPGFRLRPAEDGDAETVARFANAEAQALIGTPVLSVEWLLRGWTAPGVDRENDIGVVVAPDGELAGAFQVESSAPYTRVFAVGMVAPRFHGRGIGTALAAEMERRAERFLALAPPGARVVVHSGTLAGEPRSGCVLRSRGYQEVRRFQLMRVEFDSPPPAPASVPGIDVRTIRDGDEESIHRAHVDAFADHWGHAAETFETFRHMNFTGGGFDPALWWLAWDGDRLAGYLGATMESEERETFGYVQLLGVRREYRRRGIGELLLRTAFHELAARGRTGCDLHVDEESQTGATRLYARVGMAAHPRFATWEKVLRPGG